MWTPTSALFFLPFVLRLQTLSAYQTLPSKHSTERKILVYARLEVIRVMWTKKSLLGSCEKYYWAGSLIKNRSFLFGVVIIILDYLIYRCLSWWLDKPRANLKLNIIIFKNILYNLFKIFPWKMLSLLIIIRVKFPNF